MTLLHALPAGAKGKIIQYASTNSITERLQEMGLIPGTLFTIVRRAPLGGPLEIAYGQSRIALRAEELSIHVERMN
ncbi:MAG: ferrous iron transport protein A [Candidatus Kapabacteria bacterium]|nr:ferrous iron transport protein A [Candidatus Kapabacteria bacterium]